MPLTACSLRRARPRTVLSSASIVFLLTALAACGGGGDGGGGGVVIPTPELDAITDLAVTAGSDNSVTLVWTSPQPLAKADYTIHYELFYGVATDGVSLPVMLKAPAPDPDTESGVPHVHEVEGLSAGVRYVFHLVAGTDQETWSLPSNSVVATAAVDFDATPPAAITNLQRWDGDGTSITVAWSTSGDDGIFGEAQSYDLRWHTEPIIAANWDLAQPVLGTPEPTPVAGLVQMTIAGFAPGAVIYCAVVAYDDEDQASDLSNVVALVVEDINVFRVFVDGSGDVGNIQQAVWAAGPGDLVLVGPGRYTWTNQASGDSSLAMITIPRSEDGTEHTGFTVRSMAGPERTILDAEGHTSVVMITGGSWDPPGGERQYQKITIDGFTITGGGATGQFGSNSHRSAGGGLYMHVTASVIRNCIITGNEATEAGAAWVGGQGGATFENCRISNNSAASVGGILVVNSLPRVTIRDCEITDNESGFGGGVAVVHASFTMDNCLVARNDGGSRGGGLFLSKIHPWVETGYQQAEPTVITNCTIVDNEANEFGSGIYISDDSIPRIERTVVSLNFQSSGISGLAGSWVEMGCSVIWDNPQGNSLPFNSVDLGGLINADPLFTDLVLYEPGAPSPCWPENRDDDCGVIGALGPYGP